MKSTFTTVITAIFGLGLLLGGCGSSGSPGADAGADTGADTGAAVEGGVTSDAGAVTVIVAYQGKSHAVDLARPTPVTLSGSAYARLSDLVALALPGVAQGSLQADFEASDGFRPGKKSNCKGIIPVDGATLTRGYVHTRSRNLRWDDSLALPGCMAVRDLARVLLTHK